MPPMTPGRRDDNPVASDDARAVFCPPERPRQHTAVEDAGDFRTSGH